MTTLHQSASGQIAIPSATVWYLADLGEFCGKQEIYTRQSPQRMKALREQEDLSKKHQQKLGLMQDLLTGKVPVRVGEPEASDA